MERRTAAAIGGRLRDTGEIRRGRLGRRRKGALSHPAFLCVELVHYLGRITPPEEWRREILVRHEGAEGGRDGRLTQLNCARATGLIATSKAGTGEPEYRLPRPSRPLVRDCV